jgi:hypothetical protein
MDLVETLLTLFNLAQVLEGMLTLMKTKGGPMISEVSQLIWILLIHSPLLSHCSVG